MEIKYNEKEDCYFIKEKIGSQTLLMEFANWQTTKEAEYFNISLQIYSKRKHMDYEMDNVVSTGKNPIQNIYATIKAFSLLEEEVLNTAYPTRKIILHCQWTNNKRRNAYEKFLTKRGYKFGKIEGEKCLMKIREPIEEYD